MIIYKGHKINDVKVAVENITATTPSCNLQEIRITSNGTYTPSGNIDGYNKVVVNVPNSGGSGSGEYDIIECTNLTITANDVEYNQSTTTINYTAKCAVKDNIAGEVTTCTLYGKAISDDFGVNNTQENRLITISFTYKGVTATTQIIQDCKSGTVTDDYTLAFEFSNAASLDYKLNGKTYTADHSPYSVNIKGDLGIGVLTDVSNMFNNKGDFVTKITSFPNTSNVTTMEMLFFSSTSLSILNLSNFNTSNVTNMSEMFYDCRSLTTLDVSKFDTSKVTNMFRMFYNCRNLTSIDLSNFNTSNVTDMRLMFNDCTSLTSLDLSSFDTSKVRKMDMMFSNCSSLTTLDLSNWGISSSCSTSSMFLSCDNLKTIYMRNCLPTSIEEIKLALKQDNINAQIITE